MRRFATKYQLRKLRKIWKDARNTPVVTFSMGKPDMASIARKFAYETTTKMAIKAGVKVEEGRYCGINLKTGEFVK